MPQHNLDVNVTGHGDIQESPIGATGTRIVSENCEKLRNSPYDNEISFCPWESVEKPLPPGSWPQKYYEAVATGRCEDKCNGTCDPVLGKIFYLEKKNDTFIPQTKEVVVAITCRNESG